MTAIRFENVTKQYANAARPAVDSVSCDVDEGSFVVLLGPSGCGKTTLLKMVNRLYEPTSGTIYLGQQDIREMDATTLRRQIGYVIQQIGLFPHMTVAQNVGIVPDLLNWEPERIRQRVDELLALVDLPPDEYRDRYPSQMSGGQRQRVGVARALAGDPDVILMDEPFGAIDAITRTGLQDELIKLQRKLKKTILFVTHDVEEALRLADKIIILKDGRIVQYDTPFNILSHPANQFVYDLVGADDIIRQLGLVRVDLAMKPLPADFVQNGRPTIARDDNLRRALSMLLNSNAPALTVTENDRPVGLLTLSNIQAYQ
ncbi:MAG: ABC transporter ATP-binding protein [Ardenticatenaceae bacterium]|nr:ABC transporter ATP-binding protein [Ardenticatenaceae bacterium]MCB8947284.1 ABC transporter ATP-binding protein [Ardenticatenaceae bacterium]